MADEILGSGYVPTAKPFNVLNPSGVSAESSLGTIAAVGEGNRQRAFQGRQNAADRQQRASEQKDNVRLQERQLAMNEQGQQFQQGMSQRQQEMMEKEQAAARDDEMYRRRMERHMLRVQQIQDQIDFINENGVEPPQEGLYAPDRFGMGAYDAGGPANTPPMQPLTEAELMDRTASLYTQLQEALDVSAKADLAHSLYTSGRGEMGKGLIAAMTATMDSNIQTLSADLADLPALLSTIRVGAKPSSTQITPDAVGAFNAKLQTATVDPTNRLASKAAGPTALASMNPFTNPMEGGAMATADAPGQQVLQADELVQFLTAKLADRGLMDTDSASRELGKLLEAADAVGQGNKGAMVSLEASRDALVKTGADMDFVDAALFRASRLMSSAKSAVGAQAAQMQGQLLEAGDDPDKGITEGQKNLTAQQERFLKAMRGYANATRSDGEGRLVKGWGKSGFVKLYEVDPKDPSKLGAAVNVGAMVSDVMIALTNTQNPMDAIKRLTDADPDNDPQGFEFVQRLDPGLRKELVQTMVKHLQGMDANIRDQAGIGLDQLDEFRPEVAKGQVRMIEGERTKLTAEVKKRELGKEGAKRKATRDLQQQKKSALDAMVEEEGGG
jgi:hypothetical protein